MANRPSSPDADLARPFSRNRRAGAALKLGSSTGEPLGAGKPKLYKADDASFSKFGDSIQPLLTDSAHEAHRITSFGPEIPLVTSPIQMSTHLHDQHLPAHSWSTRWEVLQYLIRKTCMWVLAGVLVMLLGIGVAQAIVLPKVHTCPASATCPGSYDPNNGNFLQLLQAFMSYWLKGGVMISSIGILKLAAYQAWFTLMHQGNTIKNLDLHLGAIRGSVNDAFYLLFKKNNRLLAVFIFALLGIGAAISLVTGLSIEKDVTTQIVTFQFNGSSELPDSSLAGLNNDGQLKATQKVISWALAGDKSHDGALRGTLVVPDARTAQARNAIPGGPKITGWFECEEWNNYTAASNSSWHIWFGETRYVALSDMSLAVSLWMVDTAVARYVWVSNSTGLIPNATTTMDGGMNIALCTHRIQMEPEQPGEEGVDYLLPSQTVTSGCDGGVSECVADAVNNAILNWWGGTGTAFWHITCRGGVLGPIPSSTDAEKYCPITQELWEETAVSMLDGILQTAPRSLLTTQDLHAVVEGLNKHRWWVNAAIPAATVLLYIVVLVYTCALSQGDKVLKELNLEEVIQAAQTDHIHDLVLTRRLKKTPIRYHSDVGFVNTRDGVSTMQANA